MILDTCAVLWLATGAKKLSRTVLKRIGEAPAVYVSAVSGFEIAIKKARGKLDLPAKTDGWFGHVIEHHGLTLLSLDLDLCIRAAELPSIHDDPCDRFIIATAKKHNLAVVTGDERFEEYGVTVIN